jgi:hypothetical protein
LAAVRPSLTVRRNLAIGLAVATLLVARTWASRRHHAAALAHRDVAAFEAQYSTLRSLRDTIDVTRARGQDRTPRGEPLDGAVRRFTDRRATVQGALTQITRGVLPPPDRAALSRMALTLSTDLADDGLASDTALSDREACDARPAVAGEPTDTAAAGRLERHLYVCFGRAAARIVAGRDTMDRLTVAARIGEADDPAERRRLFMALGPLWRTVNGDDGAGSPYRAMLRLVAARGTRATPSPLERARMLGVDPVAAERWLTATLDAWRTATPDSLIEPWDYQYLAGAAGRRLNARIPRDSLLPITQRYYRSLGADVSRLGVHYDLDARSGKTPVANTTFGARGHADAIAWVPSESWVFATYGTGGIDNLEELIHETGHAAHLAAIRTRPAYEDWPDSDPFTEAVPDIAALEVYEPLWQSVFLGDSVPTPVAMRAKYAGVVLDITWALFEVRLYEHPEADPNHVWTELTSRYLHIRPHPELSWWATRGQLIDAPGYMMNYALGAVIVAALRERVRTVHGPFDGGDPAWYPWLSEHLLRFGRSRPTRDVLEEFLGRPLSIDPLLRDLARMQPTSARAR